MREPEVYYDHEILKVLYGLDNIYWSRPWYTRWIYAQWHRAIVSIALMLCSELLHSKSEQKEAVGYFENLIDES